MASSSNPATPLLYACIAHNSTILAECTSSTSSSMSSLASLVLPKIEHSTAQKLTYTHGTHHIHYIAEAPADHEPPSSAGGLTFLVIANADQVGRRVGFAFLTDVRANFLAAFPEATVNFGDMPNYGCASFNADLRKVMMDVGGAISRGEGDALNNVRREMNDVRGIMTRNIEGLLERGERIDLLVDKTDRLGGSAREFRVRSRGLKRQMWWKNVKLMGLLGLVVVLIILAIAILVKNGS